MTRPSTPAKKLRILIVDPGKDAAGSLPLLLSTCGHEVDVACDPSTALSVAETKRPEVVLVNLSDSYVDDFEIARMLRDRPATKNAVLIAITGYAHPFHRRRMLQAGFDGHLIKPVDGELLISLLSGNVNEPADDGQGNSA